MYGSWGYGSNSYGGGVAYIILLQKSVSDSGLGSDTIGIKAKISVLEGGNGIDIATIKQFKAILDLGTGTDETVAKPIVLAQDSGIGQDLISPIKAKLTIADLGNGVDIIGLLTSKILLQDNGAGVDIVQGQNILSVADLGSGSDIIETILTKRLVQDSGVGSEIIQKIIHKLTQDAGSGVDTIYRKITFKPSVIDDEDFSKPIIVQEYRTIVPYPLWLNKSVSAGATTDEIDVSMLGSFGALIKVSSPTTIEFQIESEVGWETIDTIDFDDPNGGTQFYPFWTIQFGKCRFCTTQATTATIQLYLRT